MPSVMTGANLANRDLIYVGVSGDGDSASIGIGQFAHIVRRRINMLYIVDNNGTYGLTKGQFSATNDKGSTNKKGVVNLLRSDRSGVDGPADRCQLRRAQLLRRQGAARASAQGGHGAPGFAFIDVISPCVAFNNHEGSTKSYSYVREHSDEVVAADLRAVAEETRHTQPQGSTRDVRMPDGSTLRLHKLAADHDPTDRAAAVTAILRREARARARSRRGCSISTRSPWTATRSSVRARRPQRARRGCAGSRGAEQLAAVNASFR